MASLLAAVMSTSDAQMVVSSGLFTENIYKRHLAPDRSDSHYLWVARFAGLVIVLAALILQATFTDVIHAMKVVIKTPAAIGISMWFGIFWETLEYKRRVDFDIGCRPFHGSWSVTTVRGCTTSCLNSKACFVRPIMVG